MISLLHGCQPPKPLSGTLGFSSGHKHRFVLQALDRTYTLSAESESERKHWVDQLGLRISERKAPASDSAHELAVRRKRNSHPKLPVVSDRLPSDEFHLPPFAHLHGICRSLTSLATIPGQRVFLGRFLPATGFSHWPEPQTGV